MSSEMRVCAQTHNTLLIKQTDLHITLLGTPHRKIQPIPPELVRSEAPILFSHTMMLLSISTSEYFLGNYCRHKDTELGNCRMKEEERGN
jgi:hypothetical protein